MQKVTINDTTYEYLSWQVLGEEMFHLAQQILQSGKRFDRVVALAKGGLAFSRSLTDYLAIKDLSTMQIELYTGINETSGKPVITQNLPVSIRDQDILVFDDVVDHGVTMKLAVDYLKTQGAAEIVTSTLVCKPWSTFLPDFLAYQTDSWVIFPNESRETIGLLQKQWQEKNMSLEEICQNLAKIGFPRPEVEFFTQLK